MRNFSMLKKLIPLAVLPFLAFAQPAHADRLFWWQSDNLDQPPPPPSYRQVYGAPDYGSLYGSPDDQLNDREYQLYLRDMRRRYGYSAEAAPYQGPYDEPPRFYGQPQQVAPTLPFPPPKPKIKKLVKAKPVVPADPTAATEKQVTETPPKKSAEPVTCEKGASIVSGFGFDKVTSKSCAAGSLVYNAERSGQPFEIDVNPKTGELIAVKKLQVAKELSDKVAPLVQPLPQAKTSGQEI